MRWRSRIGCWSKSFVTENKVSSIQSVCTSVIILLFGSYEAKVDDVIEAHAIYMCA